MEVSSYFMSQDESDLAADGACTYRVYNNKIVVNIDHKILTILFLKDLLVLCMYLIYLISVATRCEVKIQESCVQGEAYLRCLPHCRLKAMAGWKMTCYFRTC